MNAADAAGTAGTAGSPADRPQSKQRRGSAAGGGLRENCGKTAGKLREHSSTLTVAPLVADPAPLEPRPPRRRAVQTPAPAAADRTPAELAPSLAPACPSQVPREGNPAPAPIPAGPMQPHEAAVIAAALAILEARLRSAGPELTTPHAVKTLLRLRLAERDREVFAVLYLDAQHRLIAYEEPFAGSLTQTSVYPRELVRRALAHNAAAVILAHNHPSGAAEPSRADEHLTQACKSALGLVDARVLDHVVIGAADAVSMAERGLL
jgi:DNA repair protein RadC